MKYIINLFKGRINRVNFLLSFFLSFVWLFVGIVILALLQEATGYMLSTPIGILSILIFVLFFVFILSIQIRRWHDMGHSGFFFILNNIPFVILWSFLKKGQSGVNKYGDEDNKKWFRSIFGL